MVKILKMSNESLTHMVIKNFYENKSELKLGRSFFFVGVDGFGMLNDLLSD